MDKIPVAYRSDSLVTLDPASSIGVGDFASFPFKSQMPVIRPAIAVIMILVLMLFGVAASIPFFNGMPKVWTMGGGAFLGLIVGIIIWPHVTRRVTPLPIEVADDVVVLPKHMYSTERVQIPISDLIALELRASSAAQLLVIGTKEGHFLFPSPAFIDPNGAAAVREVIRAKIALGPSGVAARRDVDSREQGVRNLTNRDIWATLVLLAVLGAVFGVELFTGAPGSPAATLRVGANAPALVAEGQWWRLFSAGFLHLGWLHVLLNFTVLASFGIIVEKLLGTSRFLIVALTASLAGNLASLLTRSHVYSAGASSMIFGLIGAWLVINLRHRESLPAGFFLSKWAWIRLLGLNLIISLLPGVDGLAHLGGLIAGGLITYFLVPELDIGSPQAHPKVRVCAAGLIAAFVVALGYAGVHAWRLDDKAADLEMTRATLGSTKLSNDVLHQLTSEVAANSGADRETLQIAARVQRRLVDGRPEEVAYAQTLIALQNRLEKEK